MKIEIEIPDDCRGWWDDIMEWIKRYNDDWIWARESDPNSWINFLKTTEHSRLEVGSRLLRGIQASFFPEQGKGYWDYQRKLLSLEEDKIKKTMFKTGLE